MQDDSASYGRLGVILRQHRRDIFIGQTMKAVAPYPPLSDGRRQGEGLGDRRVGMVEGGVETGDLRQRWRALQQDFDGGEVVRLMQWGQRHQAFELVHYLGIDPHGYRVLDPT